MDPASFHQVLANSALNMSLLRNIDKVPESYEAISHHTCAINLVNKRLSDPNFATSDEVIGAVTAFICYYVRLMIFGFESSHSYILRISSGTPSAGESI
jgi:hypothetical protein